LINNRQGGRRRGRGGQRPQNLGGRPDGNRQDNRQRGNAAQLLEKYKSMARDAQLSGDRVQTEYYLQYADHYFRVLEDSRSRFEQQEAQRRPRRDDEEYESDGDEEMAAEGDSGEDDGETEVRQQPRGRDRDRDRGGRDRYERSERNDRGDRAQQGRSNGAPREVNEPDYDSILATMTPDGTLPEEVQLAVAGTEDAPLQAERRGADREALNRLDRLLAEPDLPSHVAAVATRGRNRLKSEDEASD